MCRPGQLKIVGAPRKEAITIACEVEANPPDVEIFWKFTNTNGSVDIPTTRFSMDSTRSLLEYTAMTELDYGTFMCWAKNDQGTQAQPCLYHVIPAAGRPEELVNCSITNQTLDSLQIMCEPGYDGGLAQEFVLELYESQTGMLVSSVSSQSPWFTVNGLSSGLGFDIALYAKNVKGSSDVFTLHAYPLKSAARRTALSPVIVKLTPVLGVLVGILISLTVLFIGVLLLLRLRHKDYHTKKPHNTSVKVSCESVDSAEKNPDVIPQSTDIQDAEEKAYERVNFYNSTCMHTKDTNKAKNEEYTDLEVTSGLLCSITMPQLSDHNTLVSDDTSLVGVTSGTLDRRRIRVNDQLTRF